MFISKINSIRVRELFLIKLEIVVDTIGAFLGWMISPNLILTTFLVFFLTGHEISLARAYAGIQVFKFLEFPLRWIPEFISALLEWVVSMKRIHKFMECSEINPELVNSGLSDITNTDTDVKVDNANFTWGGVKQELEKKDTKKEEQKETEKEKEDLMSVKDWVLLRSLNLTIYKGEFIWIIGEVGAGKSSLINAILGDMIYINDATLDEFKDKVMDDSTRDLLCAKSMLFQDIVKLGGSVGLVQQTPWIQNQTIRENIIFGLPLDEDKYNRTIEACQLAPDLEILKGGDLTEIGEKGINLSGGQKARISLARAVYSNCDIVLMDDPVSALDSNVKHKVFDEVFWGELKFKTRILVTHAVDFLHNADRIVIMEKGKIKNMGTYEELEHSEEIKHVIETIAKTHIEEDKHAEENDDIIDEAPEDDKNGRLTLRKSFLSDLGTQITEDENKEIIDVNFDVYQHLFLKDNNWITYVVIIPLFVCYAYCAVYTTYYYGNLIEHANRKEDFWKNFGLALLHPLGYSSLVVVLILIIYLSTVRKSRLLHERMISQTMDAPINTYFDKTPSGKILNRYSRDLNKIDSEIFRNIMWTVEWYVWAWFDIYVATLNR